MEIKMFLYYICYFINIARAAELPYLDPQSGWNYINLPCRDNDNKPVDWWYIYKPPSDAGPAMESGRKFAYLTPDTAGHWVPSDRYITDNSMLQNTLAPLFRPTYSDDLAMVAYEGKGKDNISPGSSVRGLMLADEMGGLWIDHTVKGFPDLTKDRLTFPEEELSAGQLIVCMSLRLVMLNDVAVALRTVSPRILELKIPPGVKSYLPDWEYMSVTQVETLMSKSSLQLTTRKGSLRAEVIVRRPGQKKCLYKSFAKSKNIVLDVYRHDSRLKPVCDNKYSVRNIDAISLKYSEKVFYIDNTSDHIGFAVSTAAHWQQRTSKAKPPQYWTCTSNIENIDRSGKGGLILCVEDYRVWRSFDTLKVKEPEC